MNGLQTDWLAATSVQRFEARKASPGGAQVLRIAYAVTAKYARRWQRTGRRVSVRLVWETLRDNVHFIRARRQQKFNTTENGFALNDHFHAHVARHIMEHRPEWRGLFETRALGAVRKRRRVLVVEDSAVAGPRLDRAA